MSSIIEITDKFVSDLFSEKLSNKCVYHNYTHTKRVFKSTKEIIDNITISEEDKKVLLLTALLHDIGYIEGGENHEERSVEIATDFLKLHEESTELISKVSQCIMATKMTHIPSGLLEKIIKDADASHFAKDYYPETSEFLRKEMKLCNVKDFSAREWLKENIDMFRNKHSYYTDYAIQNWKPKKEENLAKMIEEEHRLKEKKKKKNKEKKELKERQKKSEAEKGIQTLFRVTLRNHLKLSDIADTKANILLSVNAIIISLALSNLIPKLDNPSNKYLVIPTVIFIIFSIASMILSILATRPNVTSGSFTQKEVDERKVNLLFFGNFHKMPLSRYAAAMDALMEDKQYIYDSMIKDLYFLGKVLHRKYKILRITYTVFMIGIIVSVGSFIIAFLMFN